MWVMTDVFAQSEVATPVQPSELVLVCLGYFEVEDFHSESVVVVVARVKFVSMVDMCFFARWGQYDCLYFFASP